jgi:hypothetical protein
MTNEDERRAWEQARAAERRLRAHSNVVPFPRRYTMRDYDKPDCPMCVGIAFLVLGTIALGMMAVIGYAAFYIFAWAAL